MTTIPSNNPSESQRYLVRTGGKIEGPFSLGELRGKILNGTIPESAEVAAQDSEVWHPLQELYDRMFPSWR